MVKVCVEQATLLGFADKRGMMNQSTTDSPEEQSSSFNFRVLPFHKPATLPRLENPIPITRIYEYKYIYYIYHLVVSVTLRFML